MGKGEIAGYEQFLFFPQCFQKAHFLGASKGVIVWEWVNGLLFTSHKIVQVSELKAILNKKIKCGPLDRIKIINGRVENILEKEEMLINSISPFPSYLI